MTNKEIKLSARKNISQNMGNCVSLTAFLFAVFVFLGLCELALFMLFKRIGWEYFFSWQGIKDHVSVRLFWSTLRVSIIAVILSPPKILIRSSSSERKNVLSPGSP